jgi:antitoxin YefM
MRTLPLSEADAGLTQIADEVHRTRERVTLTKDGHPYLVLISPEDLASIEATLELLADTEAVRRVEQARQDVDEGRGTSGDQMTDLMAARQRGGGT